MFKRRAKKDNSAGLDMSPLIDMTFLLLIFFMVSSTFNKDMKVDLQRPGASSAQPASGDSIKIYIDRNSTVYVDEQAIKLWVLQSKVREMMQGQKDKPILVVTDKGVPADRLLEVVDQCRLAGATDIGVATDQEAGA